MKENKGVTLTSLIIYVFVLIIVVAIVGNITSFFYTNVVNAKDSSQNIATITKFNMYFTKDVKKMGNSVVSVAKDKSYIKFASGNVYTFQNNAIYMNQIKICDNVANAQFQVEQVKNKKIVTVLMTVGQYLEATKTTKFVMNQM